MAPARRAAAGRDRPHQRAKKTSYDYYHDEMRKLMSFLHPGRTYSPKHKWSKRELRTLNPDKIMRYLLTKIYGDENADPDNDPPIHHRRNSVLFWKKAWSHFMLDQSHQ